MTYMSHSWTIRKTMNRETSLRSSSTMGRRDQRVPQAFTHIMLKGELARKVQVDPHVGILPSGKRDQAT